MKRNLLTAALLGVLLTATTASAQFRENAVLLTMGGGVVSSTLEDSGEAADGNGAGFTLEKVLADGKINLGFSISWLWTDGTATLENENAPSQVSYKGVPFQMVARYNFLNSRFAANIGLGLGVHTSTRFVNEGTVGQRKDTTSGMVFSLPVEVAYFVDPDMYLLFTYTPSVMRSTPMRDDFAHAFILGVGFQWGAEKD